MQAKELLEKYESGEIAIEQAGAIMKQFPNVVGSLTDMMKEDAKQHTEISKAELQSVDKLSDLMKEVWNDTSATPEQKQAQCDKIMEQQNKILKSKEKREETHGIRKDYVFYTICGVLTAAALYLFCRESPRIGNVSYSKNIR